MGFSYDPIKARANFNKHKVVLADAEGVFEDPFASRIEDPNSESEQRFIAVGRGSAGRVLVVVYSHDGEDVRAISARPASRKEREHYESGVRFF